MHFFLRIDFANSPRHWPVVDWSWKCMFLTIWVARIVHWQPDRQRYPWFNHDSKSWSFQIWGLWSPRGWILRTVPVVTDSGEQMACLLETRFTKKSTNDGRLAQGPAKILGCKVPSRIAERHQWCARIGWSRQEVVWQRTCFIEVTSKYALWRCCISVQRASTHWVDSLWSCLVRLFEVVVLGRFVRRDNF